jgi:hypothetical protein
VAQWVHRALLRYVEIGARSWIVTDRAQLAHALIDFRFFYNHVRPHQRLGGRTPAEAWKRVNPFARPHRAVPFSTWEGLLARGVLLTSLTKPHASTTNGAPRNWLQPLFTGRLGHNPATDPANAPSEAQSAGQWLR